jgi:hypothetical protein
LRPGYDGLYTAANAAVTYTQTCLFGKLALTRRSDTAVEELSASTSTQPHMATVIGDKPRSALAVEEASGGFTDKNLRFDLAFTLAGQMIFLATYL